MKSVVLCSALVVMTLAMGAHAKDLDQDEALRLRREGVIMPLEQLMQPALQRYPMATLLGAELEDEHGVLVYEVELLTQEGVVRELDLDAHNGQILKDEEDD
ncbi:Peptidase [Pseudomonas marincola]|uniref:Peptidase n=1 Tax=Pseudomonas marincola TaxID=437900 RepID=A0A653E935_9PSED|nr:MULTISPECIES: PepSY domain-containing protein [Pseudomonas]MAB97560.1 peptidase [Pseudomonadaceae bacterium]OEO25571.1 peptidase [Pseudomonas sp. J237]CAE6920007.1 Peptidase [Pseudomonas marincola]